ncbi:lung seven transmembrane receptor domain-containing protein [Ditylenchus destructor]|uniref:Lung seven transmembrane receptor domain-containing protein n=1 Tax=Ditylenchus destructor TaxID=166010 RepID=A0AAD4N8C0_9BILA|nr:lung seven transmembrane receptor domain-containing protein [Ditylenchus destructor]
MHFLIFFFVFYGLGSPAIANLLIPGIMTETVQLAPNYPEYLGFLQSALNGTEVEIRIQCQEEIDVEFEVQFVIRSSPCAKEFILDKGRYDQEFYFNEEHMVPQGYHYDKILFFKSKPQKFSCLNRNGVDLFMEQFPVQPMEVHNVTEYQSTNGSRQAGSQSIRMNTNLKRKKRSSYPGLNGDSIDGGAKRSLTSWHPVQKLPIDSIYILILKISLLKQPPNGQQPPKIQAEVQWRGPYGFLSAIDYPLLRFYGFMCFFYMILAMSWLFVCLRHWRDLLRIQFWIGAVILIGMIEKAVFYAEYANMNESGQSIEGLLEVAELTSCLKRTMAHVLIIIVSVGFGVVKPRLGATLNQVVAVGIVYFIFCALEGLTRVSKVN